ncbi:F-box domain-containing protein [Mycena venus]|uniref:F-box domain-containing protein n=1 Tax=Mycena venus TaxID=2733690 RepID=A0A8H6WXT0_9AGAR|nr:F-box domain-containing protein [Mycena venus]
MTLLSLPTDILLSILVLLYPEDILLVSQTCRALHEYTLNDYLWHRILDSCRLPLDIPYVDPNHLPGPTLQAIVTRALRVDHNWRRPNPQIRKMTRLGDLDNVLQMQFIGSDWLVVLRRAPASLSVWRVANTDQPYRAALIDLPGPEFPLSFCAAMQMGGREVLIALISGTRSGTQLSAYSVSLKPQLDDDASAGPFTLPAPTVICRIDRQDSEGRFYEVHVCSHTIAVGIPQFVDHVLIPGAYRILIVNSTTRAQCLIDPGFAEVSSKLLFNIGRYLIFQQLAQLHFQVCARQLVLAAVRNQSTVVVRIHDLPAAIFNETTVNSKWSESLESPNAEYESSAISDVDYHLSANSMRNTTHISFVAFHSIFSIGNDVRVIYSTFDSHSLTCLDLGPSRQPPFACPFRTELGASPEIVSLGETGQRAVWLERRWSSDEYTLMKAAFSPNRTDGNDPVVVQPLFARHLALPFELHTCRSLAFEEATGRVSLALHTGELYILQF